MTSYGQVDSNVWQIATLKARVLQASTRKEISAIWQEVQALRAGGSPAGLAQKPGEGAKALAEAEEHSDSTSAGSRTPPSCCSAWLEKSPKSLESSAFPKSPYDFQIRVKNTFIEVPENTDEEVVERRARSCPPLPAGSCEPPEASFSVLAAAVERLRWQEAPVSGALPLGMAASVQEVASGNEEVMAPPLLSGNNCPPSGCSPIASVACVTDVLKAIPAGLPSMGSALHADGRCKPCAFVHTKGCASGQVCRFCHLCDHESSKRRKKAWRKFGYGAPEVEGRPSVRPAPCAQRAGAWRPRPR